MAVLARELGGRGHVTTFIGFPDMQAKLPCGTRFASFGKERQPLGSLQAYLRRFSKLGTIIGVRGLIRDLASFAETTCRDLPKHVERLEPDALVIDQTDFAASLVARAMDIPFVTVANALPMNPEPSVPPPVLPWRYDPTPQGVRRNLVGYQIAHMVERPLLQVIRSHAHRFGIASVRYGHETWSERCQLTQCIKGFDFPRQQLPSTFHYVGPFRECERVNIRIPPSQKPLVFCSLGTLQGSRGELFCRIASAVSDLDLDLLIAHGGLLADSEILALPGNPQVHAFVPQRTVLERSAIAVTHAGFNTVSDALACATPMVALPIALEQPATAARLSRSGVAEVMHCNSSRKRIRQAIEKVISDGSYRANAKRLASELAAAGGVSRAADLVEQSCRLYAPPASATKAPPA